MDCLGSSYQLVLATDSNLLTVKSWFSDQQQILTWGGPNMYYPISDETFMSLLQESHLSSYCLLDPDNSVVAFGQFYLRLDRHHLGRLVVSPKHRNQGLVKKLIFGLLEMAVQINGQREASLFVYKDNSPALRAYSAIGFKTRIYPADLPPNMQDCLYMVLD